MSKKINKKLVFKKIIMVAVGLAAYYLVTVLLK